MKTIDYWAWLGRLGVLFGRMSDRELRTYTYAGNSQVARMARAELRRREALAA